MITRGIEALKILAKNPGQWVTFQGHTTCVASTRASIVRAGWAEEGEQIRTEGGHLSKLMRITPAGLATVGLQVQKNTACPHCGGSGLDPRDS